MEYMGKTSAGGNIATILHPSYKMTYFRDDAPDAIMGLWTTREQVCCDVYVHIFINGHRHIIFSHSNTFFVHQIRRDFQEAFCRYVDKYGSASTQTLRTETSVPVEGTPPLTFKARRVAGFKAAPGEMWAHMQQQQLDLVGASSVVAADEIATYLVEPLTDPSVNPLEWWKGAAGRFPILSRMARDFLAIPATSASSERAFSGARHTVSTFRHKLGSETLRQCMCLKTWIE